MKIFSGTSNTPLAEKIADGLGERLSPLEVHIFPDGEKRIRVQESVVDEDCIIVQPTAPPVAENYIELFFIVDALKRSGAKSACAVIPYVGYQRQDHVFRSGEAVSLSVVVKTLGIVGATSVITFDLHSIRIPQTFTIPITHLSALPLFAEKIKEIIRPRRSHALGLRGRGGDDVILVSPDMGGVRRIKLMSQYLGNMAFAAIEKHRDLKSGIVSATEIREFFGKLPSRAIIIDDMISSGKTIETAATLLRSRGVIQIYVFATHAVFSDGAPIILQNAGVEKVFVTDSIYIPREKQFPRLVVLSLADIIAKAILDSK